MRPSSNPENKTLSDTYWKVQLVCTKVQALHSLEPPLEYNQDQTPWWIKVCYDCFNHLASYRDIMQFQSSSRRKNTQRNIQVIMIRVFRKVFSNFTLSEAWDNTSSSLNGGAITDLPLLRTLVAICQAFREPSFWEVMDSCFISICNWQLQEPFYND